MLRLIFRRLVVGHLVGLTVMTLAFLLTRLSGGWWESGQSASPPTFKFQA